VSERSALAAKLLFDSGSRGSMAAVGYRLRFRHTAATVTGEADTYGNVRALLEREPVKDVRVALSGEMRLLGAGEGTTNAFGLQLTLGSQAVLPRNLSPITQTRTVFNPY
jgi:hypothetical protein